MNTYAKPHLRAALLAGILLALVLGACGGDSDPSRPPAPDITVGFRPISTGLNLTVGGSADLWVEVEGTDDYTVSWRYGAQTADTDSFHLLAAQVGVDTVWATVVAPDRERNRTWRVEIEPNLSDLPREISGLTLAHEIEPAAVNVSWLRSAPTVHEIDRYEVAVSYDGPITTANWDQAVIQAELPHAGQPVRPHLTISDAEHGLQPGLRAWFAVRAVDVLGQASRIKESFPWDVTYPWRLDVRVVTDAGDPFPGVILIYGPDDARAATDADGRANIGPFRNIDSVPVATRAGDAYSNYTVLERGVDDGPLAITVIEKYALDLADCGASGNPATTFMGYLQYMTRTDQETVNRPNRELYHWREYPVRVHFAERDTVVDDVTYQLADSLRSAMEIWNAHVGFELMTEVPDEASADILCGFGDLGTGYLGYTYSADTGSNLEAAIPRLFEITLDLDAIFAGGFNTLAVTEVTLHEFGHALGLFTHTCASGKGNLMDWAGAIGILADGPANAIKLTEMRAVRTIANLPQSVDMSGYELGAPAAR